MKPQLPIDVDEETGVWTTDGLPMLYVRKKAKGFGRGGVVVGVVVVEH